MVVTVEDAAADPAVVCLYKVDDSAEIMVSIIQNLKTVLSHACIVWKCMEMLETI